MEDEACSPEFDAAGGGDHLLDLRNRAAGMTERAIYLAGRAVEMRDRAIEMRRGARRVVDLLAVTTPDASVARRAFAALPAPAAIVGPLGRIISANPAWRRVMPAARSGTDFSAAWERFGGDASVSRALRRVLDAGAGMDLQTGLPDGRRLQVQLIPVPMDHSAVLVVMIDITEYHRREQELLFEATHDPLTGTANRALLASELESALARARRYGQRPGVIYLDLDRFKALNDTHGHAAGDEILRAVTARWRQEIRAPDLLARVGGDEFVVLVHQCESTDQLAALARRLAGVVAEPFRLEATGDEVRLGVTAGVLAPAASTTVEDALAAADHAMYQAKKAGAAAAPSRP